MYTDFNNHINRVRTLRKLDGLYSHATSLLWISRPTYVRPNGLCGSTIKGNSRENETVKSCLVTLKRAYSREL